MNRSDINRLKLAQLMPLISRIKCHVRQQTTLAYTDLGYDISPEAADALMIIHHMDGLPQKQLADIMGKDKAAITRLLNSLVKAKLVKRVQDEQDRRIIRAHVTEEGAAVFERVIPKFQALSETATNGIAEEDFNRMLHTLEHIVSNLCTYCETD